MLKIASASYRLRSDQCIRRGDDLEFLIKKEESSPSYITAS